MFRVQLAGGWAVAVLFTVATTGIWAATTGSKTHLTVAADGTGDFKTVQAAIDAAPPDAKYTVTINIRPGQYKEVITIPKDKPHLAFVGTDAATTVLTFDNFAQKAGPDGKPFGTYGSASVFILASDFSAENITFENTAGPVGQAVAVCDTGDRSVFRHCQLLGWQDTLYINAGREDFEDCTIAGHVDFIFGSATAWFERCELHCRQKGSITAASTSKESPFGYVFDHCKITADAPKASTILGRPWRPFAAVTFLHCDIADAVKPVGWDNWSKTENEKTARYAEFDSTGPSATTEKRATWSHQLTEDEAKSITIDAVLGGPDHWNPTSNRDAK